MIQVCARPSQGALRGPVGRRGTRRCRTTARVPDTPAPLRQFRTAQNNEDDVTQNDLPPVGGFVLMCAGQLMLLSGAVQHVAGAYALRQRLRLTPVGCAAVLAHALLPMAAFGTAMACVVGCHPRWVCHAMWGAREALPPLLSEKRLNNLARMKLGIETGG